MKLSSINFASGIGKGHRVSVSLRTGLLGALGLLLVGALVREVISVELQRASLATQSGIMIEQLRASERQQAAISGQPAQGEIVAINRAVRQLNLPWRSIFDAVEKATADSIAVLSLAPDANSETLTIIAESQTTDAMLDYVRLLKAQPLFDDVAVSRHEINEKDPHRPVRFEVAAHWKVNQ